MHGAGSAGDVQGQLAASPLIRRVFLCFVLLIAEASCLSFFFDALPLSLSSSYLAWLGYSGYVLKVAIVFLVAIVLAIGPQLLLLMHEQGYGPGTTRLGEAFRIALHMVCFAAVFVASIVLFSAAPGSASHWLGLGWLAAVGATLFTWLVLLAPWRFWLALIQRQWLALALGMLAALLALMVAIGAQNLWGPLSAATFKACSLLLSWMYPTIVVNEQEFVLGTLDFVVRIGVQCSGYEGMGLILIFTALYLSFYRSEFAFPRALLLFPLGLITIWCFNVLRIVLLIAVGQELSADIAIGGFHSQAGWIMFIAVAVGMLLVAERSRFFSPAAPAAVGASTAQRSAGAGDPSVAAAMLVPIIALFACMLLTGLFVVTVDWLYPIRVLVVAGVLIWVWPRVGLTAPGSWGWAVAAGFVVFALWLVLVRPDAAVDEELAAQFGSISGIAFAGWLLFRTLGAVVTVPLAEELAFRGYLLARLSGAEPQAVSRLPFSLLALLGSSLAFGLLHNAWLAGALAGLVYGLVRYRSERLSDAVVAHATTNALLSGYVLLTGAWSLW